MRSSDVFAGFFVASLVALLLLHEYETVKQAEYEHGRRDMVEKILPPLNSGQTYCISWIDIHVPIDPEKFKNTMIYGGFDRVDGSDRKAVAVRPCEAQP